jgi:hypothetical protein
MHMPTLCYGLWGKRLLPQTLWAMEWHPCQRRRQWCKPEGNVQVKTFGVGSTYDMWLTK